MGKGKGTSCWYYFGGGQCGKCHGSGTCKNVKCVDCGGTGSKTGHIHGGTDPCSAQTCKRCNGEKYDPDAKGMDDRWCKECHGTGKAGPTSAWVTAPNVACRSLKKATR